jgi:hypothetical protein
MDTIGGHGNLLNLSGLLCCCHQRALLIDFISADEYEVARDTCNYPQTSAMRPAIDFCRDALWLILYPCGPALSIVQNPQLLVPDAVG